MLGLADIIKKVRLYLPDLNEQRINSAFDYVSKAHHDQYRFSGDPYLTHLLAVTDLLLPFKPDENTLIAALMHDLSETKSYDLKDLTKRFGEDVGLLVAGMERLNNLRLRSSTSEVESMRKMFLAMAGDMRVVLIRLADRLHNMETLEYVQVSKRKNIARETMNVYVPIALRLGMYRMKNQLEDICFQYLYPQQYADLELQLKEYMRQQETVIDHIKYDIKQFLVEKGIRAQVEGRLKNLYSIYKKLKQKNRTTLRELFDIFAIRVILPTHYDEQGIETTEHLYAILSLIHSHWAPLTDRFKDYIAMPKANGYKSLHTVVIGLTPEPLHQPTEIQIRSEKMHQEADFGIAAHWLYKEFKGFHLSERNQQSLEEDNGAKKNTIKQDWISGLTRLQRDLTSQDELLKPLKINLFQDRIFVLTPTGDVKDLPEGSTPVDFAYAIHTDIGHRCYSAKINGVVVPLDYRLKSGEVIDIVTRNKPDPKPHWLSFVKTANARNKIKSYFKSFDTDESFRNGKELLNKLLEQMGYTLLDEHLSLLKRYGNEKLSLKNRHALVEDIGNGSIALAVFTKKLFGSHLPSRSQKSLVGIEEKSRSQGVLVKVAQDKLKKDDQIFIAGEKNVPFKISLCCSPAKGTPIIAYVTRGRSVKIHIQGCRLLKNADKGRILEASWGSPELRRRPYTVTLVLEAQDRIGLIRDIADTVAGFSANILDFSLLKRTDHVIRRQIVLETLDQEQFRKIINALSQVRNVLKVSKT